MLCPNITKIYFKIKQFEIQKYIQHKNVMFVL